MAKIDIPFWKLESIGNDFPLLNTADLDPDLSLGNLAIKICDRRFGVGGDGLLTLNNSSRELLQLRMFNPDGTEDFCGNGIRCAARHAIDQGWFDRPFVIDHQGRRINVRAEGELIITEIGRASYHPQNVPLAPSSAEMFQVPVPWNDETPVVSSALTTGSTHTVLTVDELPGEAEFQRLGAAIENNARFPERTSVIWSKVSSKDQLQIRIWERGVGETLGCGTGASAAAVDYLRSQQRGGDVTVASRGGSVSVQATGWDQPITVKGSARKVFSGTFRHYS